MPALNPFRGSRIRAQRTGSPSQHNQLDALHPLAAQDPASIDDHFSTHPGEVRRREVAPLRPIVVHDTHVGASEGALRVLRAPAASVLA